jgi:hypothetical protein
MKTQYVTFTNKSGNRLTIPTRVSFSKSGQPLSAYPQGLKADDMWHYTMAVQSQIGSLTVRWG